MPRVVVGLLVRDGRALLVHRHPAREAFPDCWDLPGGHVEVGESAERALARELAEEIGVTVLEAAPLATISPVAGLELRAFRVDHWRGEPRNAAPDEHDDLRWLTPETSADLPLAHPAVLGWIRTATGLGRLDHQ